MLKTVKRPFAVLLSLILVFSVAGGAGIAPAEKDNPAQYAFRLHNHESKITPSGAPEGITAGEAKAVKAGGAGEKAPAAGCGCGNNPLIVVPGITDSDVALLDANGNPVLNEDGTPYVKGGFMIEEDNIIADVAGTLAIPFVKMLVTQKDDGFTDKVYEAAKPVFWRQATNPDGTPVQNLKVIKYETSFANLTDGEIDHLFRNMPVQAMCEEIGYDHVYYFAFNIIGDPMETARELDAFIQMVKEQTGHDKVNILNASLGASIFTAYCEQFKDKGDVGKVVNVVALNNGSMILRDIYAGNFDVSDESLYRDFFPTALANSDGTKTVGYLVNLLIRIMPRQILEDTLEAILNGAMDSMLRCAPNFWAMIPKEDYPALAEKWLSDPQYAVCRAKTDAFYQAQLNLEDNLNFMINEKGLRFNNVCGYNLKFSYITSILALINSDKTVNSDSVIQIESTSMGATAAPAGQQLPEEYLAAHAGSKYLSPDKGVDASTCAFPDNTWFFYNQPHEDAGCNAACMNLVGELFLNPDMENINSDPGRYPQFNTTSNSKDMRRNLVPAAQKALEEYEAGTREISAADLAELKAALAQGRDILAATKGDQAAVDAAASRLKNILVTIGCREVEPVAEPEPVKEFFIKLLDILLKAASDAAYEFVGPRGYFE